MAIHHSSDLWTLSVSSSDKPDGGLRQKASSYQLPHSGLLCWGEGAEKGASLIPSEVCLGASLSAGCPRI